jgi:hypothetical protein
MNFLYIYICIIVPVDNFHLTAVRRVTLFIRCLSRRPILLLFHEWPSDEATSLTPDLCLFYEPFFCSHFVSQFLRRN